MAQELINLVVQVTGVNESPLKMAFVQYRIGNKGTYRGVSEDPSTGTLNVLVPPGTVSLTIEAQGYKKKKQTVQIEGSSRKEGPFDQIETFQLEAKAPIVVKFRGKGRRYASCPNLTGIYLSPDSETELKEVLQSLGEPHEHINPKEKRTKLQKARILKDYRYLVLPKSKDKVNTKFKKKGDGVLKGIRNRKGVGVAGPVLEMTLDGPVILSEWVHIEIDPFMNPEKVKDLFKKMNLEDKEEVPTTANEYRIRFKGGYGLGILDRIAEVSAWEGVEYMEPEIEAPLLEEIIVPNDFLWPFSWSRNNLLLTGDAWQFLQDNVPGFTYGDDDVVVAVLDQGILSAGGIPDNPDFQGTVNDTANTTLTAAVTSPRAVIEVDSVAGISVGDRLNIGRGQDQFKRVYSINAGTKKITIDSLLLDHPGRAAVIDNPTSTFRTRLVAGGIAASTKDLTVASSAGFRVGQSISVGAQGNGNTEHAVITNIAGNVLTVQGLFLSHASGTQVESGRKVYQFFDNSAANYGMTNDGTTGDHGTACAGIIGAKGDNAVGTAGMAPNVRLMGVRVTSGVGGNASRDAFLWAAGVTSYNANALAQFTPRLIRPGADILSVSLGYGRYSLAISPGGNAAIGGVSRRGRNSRGGLVFMSAGNDDIRMPAGRWSSHLNSFGVAASIVAQFPAIGAGALFNKETRAYYSSYSRQVLGTNPVDVDFAAISGYSTMPAAGPAIASLFRAPHNPPTTHFINTTTFAGRGNVPGSSTHSCNVTAAAPARPTFTSLTTGVEQGGTTLSVTSTAGFVVGDWIQLGGWHLNALNVIQVVQITGLPGGNVINITAAPNNHSMGTKVANDTTRATIGVAAAGTNTIVTTIPVATAQNFVQPNLSVIQIAGVNYLITAWAAVGANTQLTLRPNIPVGGIPAATGITIIARSQNDVMRTSLVTVDSTAGFIPNEFVMVGNPAYPNCAISYVHQVNAGANQLRISGPLNAAGVGTTIHRGPLDYRTKFNGTSAAAPNAAGIGALVLSAKKTLTRLEVENVLQSTTKKIDVGNRGFTIAFPPPGAGPGPKDGVQGPINFGRWYDAGGAPIMPIAGGLMTPVGAADATTAAAAQGDTTITVATPGTFAIGQAIQIGAAAPFDHSVVLKIVGNVLTIEPLTQPHVAGVAVQGGGVPLWSGWYGAGRLDPVAAVTAAFNYNHDDRDLMIRNYLGDNGTVATDPTVNPIISPDIFLRNANDIQTLPALNYAATGPHQNLDNGLTNPIQTGGGLNDFRIRGYYRGGLIVNYVVRIDGTAGPDTFEWSFDGGGTYLPANQGIPIVANTDIPLSNGVNVRFSAVGGHTMGDSWAFTGTPTNHFIHARIRNRGANAPSLPGHFIRYYVALTDGTLLGNGKTPFHFPQGWDDSTAVAGISANTDSGIYLVPNPLAGNPAGIADTNPLNTPIINPVTGLAANIPQQSDFTYPCTWLAADKPPANIDLKTFLIAEVLPYDGVLAGLSPDINNNISYREIFFGDALFKNAAGTAALADVFEVDNVGTVGVQNYTVDFKADLNSFNAEDVEIDVSRRDTTGAVVTVTYGHDGANWQFPGGVAPAWATLNPPTVTGTAGAAAGNQVEVTFAGTFSATNGFNQVLLAVRLKGVHKAPVFTKTQEVVIYAEPVLLPDAGNGIAPAERPRLHEFADMLTLTAQTLPINAFGVDPGTTPNTRFRITTTFVNAAPVRAYAVMRGFVFVQQVDATRVNLILKPLEQSGMGYTPVKYYVYRGLDLNDFLAGTSAAQLRQVRPRPAASDFIESCYSINDDLNTALGTAEPLLPKSFGWDPDAQTDPNSYLDDYFYLPDASHQLAVATKGMFLGNFVGNAASDSGFEVVLQDGRVNLDLAYARATSHIINVPMGLPAQEELALRETTLSWIDPASMYGMHYFAGVVQSGNGAQKKKDMYDKIMLPFLNKNRVYADLRNETGYSLNYYGNYVDTVAGATQLHQVMVGTSSTSLTSQSYNTNGWPLVWVDNSPTNTNKVNLLYLSLRIGDNPTPLLYVQHGQYATTHVKQRFVEGANLLGTDPKWTKEVGIAYPNYNSTGLNVSTILKLYYFRQLPSPPAGGVVIPTDAFTENIFGSLELLIRERAITAINQASKIFTVAGDFTGGVDAGESIAVANGGPNTQTFTVVSAVVNGANTDITVAEAIPSGAVAGQLQFNYSQWNTDQPTRWFSGVRKHYVDAVSAPLDSMGVNPLLNFGMVGESGSAVENERVIMYLMPYHFFKDASPIRTVNRINLKGGTGLQASFWTELQNQNERLKLSATILMIGGNPIPVFEFDEIDVAGGPDKPENFLAVCLSDAEFSQIRQAMNETPFSPHHTRSISVALVGGALQTDANAVDYREYDIRIRGWDALGNYQEIPSTTMANATPVKVYTLDSNRLIYTSEDFSNLENLVPVPDQTEENRRINPGAVSILVGDPSINTLVGTFDTAFSGIATDKAAIKNQVEVDAAQLWTLAVNYNASPPFDDRPLYWARLNFNAAIRLHPWIGKQRKLVSKLIKIVEDESRGFDRVDFTATNSVWSGQGVNFGTAKKILLTGFDPLGLDTDIAAENPSAQVVLNLHDKKLVDGMGNEAMVQGVILPVRYHEFDRGVVKKFMKKYLDPSSPDKVDMIVTINQNGTSQFFDVERFAARYRDGGEDNGNTKSEKNRPGFGFSWSEFFESTLPILKFVPNPGGGGQVIYYNQAYTSSTGTSNDPHNAGPNVNTNTVAAPTGKSLLGSGGAYLSNEIFYRVARLREKLSSTTKTGHFHLPAAKNAPGMSKEDIVQEAKDAIIRSLSGI